MSRRIFWGLNFVLFWAFAMSVVNCEDVKSIDGTSCTVDTECSSGFCVDGVCCDTACTETCRACSAAKKGGGTDGTCDNIQNDTDPDDECAGGACSGAGTCAQYNGLTCMSATDCLSGYCIDGYCCNSLCDGECQMCNVASALGTCQTQCPSTCANGGVLTDLAVYPTPGKPLTIAAGDFNNDGYLDVGIRESNWSTYEVAYGQGNGTLGTVTPAASADWPNFVKAAADVNRNGYIDPREHFVDELSIWADFNGDGILDYAAYRTVFGDIGIGGSEWRPTEFFLDAYTGNANGVLTLVQTYNLGGVSPMAPARETLPTFGVADFNGDGELDLAIASYNNVRIMLGQGNGTFGWTNVLWTRSSTYPAGTYVGDVNQDGNADVLVTWSDDVFIFYPGIGDGTFPTQTVVATGMAYGSNLRFADITNDGKLDLLQQAPGELKLRPGNGDGTFGNETSYPIGASFPLRMFVADMDGDNRNDVVTANTSSSSISVLFNRCAP